MRDGVCSDDHPELEGKPMTRGCRACHIAELETERDAVRERLATAEKELKYAECPLCMHPIAVHHGAQQSPPSYTLCCRDGCDCDCFDVVSMRERLAVVEQEAHCPLCAPDGHAHVSGKPCACSGTRKAHVAFDYVNGELAVVEMRAERAEMALEAARLEISARAAAYTETTVAKQELAWARAALAKAHEALRLVTRDDGWDEHLADVEYKAVESVLADMERT